jgi:phenylacetic acid degradation operon negative regulatory protein
LLLTILGEFVLPGGGSVWTRTLIEALRVMDVEERNARQALMRVSEQGFLADQRDGRRVRRHLTDTGRELLQQGARRIYGLGANGSSWDGRWLVVFCAIPEELRAKRHHLRSRLEFAGFGFLSGSLAVTPHADREETVSAIVKDLGVADGTIVFRASTGELVGDGELIHRAWDLGALADEYASFVGRFQRRTPAARGDRFAAVVELVHEWRRFPFIDPEIPDELLPPHWPGRRARELFADRRGAWRPDAARFFEELEHM